MTRRDRLGKGLGALLGQYMEPDVEPAEVHRVSTAAIVPNPLQPRRVFTADELKDLAASIQENGLLQPLVVRTAPGSTDRYEIIAGERRFRAVTSLGWDDVPPKTNDDTKTTLTSNNLIPIHTT